MPARDEYGRFEEHDRSRRGSRDYDPDDDGGRGRSSRRGFAAMDPERPREIASMGGRASHGGQGRNWNEDDERYSRSRDRSWRDDQYEGNRSYWGRDFDPSGQGREWNDDDRERGYRGRSPYRGEEFEGDGGRYLERTGYYGQEYVEGRSTYRGRSPYSRYEDDDYGRDSSRRGFAGMNPEEHRRISAMGGRASHGGQGRGWDYRDEERGMRSRGGDGHGRREYDEDNERGGSRRGFASMDPERHREISRRGGYASHGGR
jgi:general stress protein YciG